VTFFKDLRHYMRAAMHYGRLADIRLVRLFRHDCALCGFPVLLRLNAGEHGIRCLRCRGGVVHMSMANVIRRHVGNLADLDAYELSSRGAFIKFLASNCTTVTGSEYWPDVSPGEFKNGVQCQDVEKLTYADNSFDLCTSTEVFEHVVNDMAGFEEARRVLRHHGYLIFSVPLRLDANTLERAILVHGEIQHLVEPEYHDDAIRGHAQVLAFRTYGVDIVDRLKAAGFREALIDTSSQGAILGHGRAIVVAQA
jgi:SAM-dependent methyltransferase